jgi:hypothetical protein
MSARARSAPTPKPAAALHAQVERGKSDLREVQALIGACAVIVALVAVGQRAAANVSQTDAGSERSSLGQERAGS